MGGLSQQPPEILVTARRLVKRFGDFTAVDGIDFEVRRQEAFGFLGPNGAGKSTTMRMLGTVSTPTDGELTILGLDPSKQGPDIRSRLGVVPQEDSLDTELTVRQNLSVYGRYFDLPRDVIRSRTAELLDFAKLTERADELVEPLSGGMKRRLTIARALVNQPDLLLLDEPTTGLDPQARHLLWERLDQLKQDGVSLILTTHYMDEAEQLCDFLVVMDNGRIAAEGSPRDLIARYCTREVLELRFGSNGSNSIEEKLEGIGDRIETLPNRVLVFADDGDAAIAAVHERGLRPESTLVRRSTLEDVYLRVTGRTLVD